MLGLGPDTRRKGNIETNTTHLIEKPWLFDNNPGRYIRPLTDITHDFINRMHIPKAPVFNVKQEILIIFWPHLHLAEGSSFLLVLVWWFDCKLCYPYFGLGNMSEAGRVNSNTKKLQYKIAPISNLNMQSWRNDKTN